MSNQSVSGTALRALGHSKDWLQTTCFHTPVTMQISLSEQAWLEGTPAAIPRKRHSVEFFPALLTFLSNRIKSIV